MDLTPGPKIPDEVYNAAGRAYCLAKFNYAPDHYVSEEARERHIAGDAASMKNGEWFRAVVDLAYRAGRADLLRDMQAQIVAGGPLPSFLKAGMVPTAEGIRLWLAALSRTDAVEATSVVGQEGGDDR